MKYPYLDVTIISRKVTALVAVRIEINIELDVPAKIFVTALVAVRIEIYSRTIYISKSYCHRPCGGED